MAEEDVFETGDFGGEGRVTVGHLDNKLSCAFEDDGLIGASLDLASSSAAASRLGVAMEMPDWDSPA
ncbi:hypothetical protein PtA15_1A219 [Puccinia triticina]|uniref:Uncharacterized protein n=1 Tax=Puccinia triticina TaxID=208348 RepID=A0ABY7C6Z1_9BASI|nr:uncharacterized protein PtA15_1A219 [Puccinia triticina]WAQ80881.1 hypothetical protein PtA15_1A219 [Puccinia triticina]